MSDKVASLLGFAVKANKLIYGIDDLSEGRRKRYLIVYCGSLSENSVKEVKRVALRDNVPVIKTVSRKLEDIIYKKNCKVIGVSDKQMSEAIIKYISEDYSLIKSEEI